MCGCFKHYYLPVATHCFLVKCGEVIERSLVDNIDQITLPVGAYDIKYDNSYILIYNNNIIVFSHNNCNIKKDN